MINADAAASGQRKKTPLADYIGSRDDNMLAPQGKETIRKINFAITSLMHTVFINRSFSIPQLALLK